ncbi:BRO N-terminal domain containing protein [Klebsormidium nitens]|uniref:BRO N-terminal domain containing protein n=1 Tax=Klebsormidium nitens TaxID=105231 RepID=A0A1Y1IVL9_KLENI|nr:BRO N-terminal domain containing protein [Klebsormidium nitens]|eukprot:GAQ93679.1 BRO N-terminal domain containing protein [Klebsormidium nitens]
MVHELDVLKAFVMDGTSYKVDILWDGMRPMFKANDIGTVLGMTNFHATLKSYDEDEMVLNIVRDQRGSMQETTYLTERGLYRLLMQSRKPAARPFQKWVVQVIETIRQKGHYDLEAAVYEAKEATRLAEAAAAQKIEELLVEQAKISKAATDAARHTTLINAFKKGDCLVYFGKIRDEPDSKSLIKIGSTKDLKDRTVGLEKEFGSMQIFEVFQIAKRHQTAYNDRATTKQLVELELLRYKNSLLQSNLTGTEVKEPIPYYTPPDDRRYTQRRGDKIQRYSSDGKQLLATYPGCAEAARQAEGAAPAGNLIRIAINKRTVYKGFRWAKLDRTLPDDTVQDIGETVISRTSKKGFLAMIALDRSHIVKVFADMKEAAEDRQFSGMAAISTAIKKGTKSGGHYFCPWYECGEQLRSEYLSRCTLPEERVRSNGMMIEQIHALTNDVLKRFASIQSVQTTMRIARASLKRALEEGSILKGYKWRQVVVQAPEDGDEEEKAQFD